MLINFENAQEEIVVAAGLEERLKAALTIAAQLDNLSAAAEVDVTLVDDAEIAALNSAWRGLNRPTDVLSFAQRESADAAEPQLRGDPAAPLLGDIVISAPRAVSQAREYGHSLERELVFLAVHGFLHLLGYDHQLAEDERRMRARQEEIMRAVALTREESGDAGQ